MTEKESWLCSISQKFNLSPSPPLSGTAAPPSFEDSGTGSGQALPLDRPARATYFTGREAELAQLLDELQPGRVVMLTGPGGRGETTGKAEKRERGGS